jgi:hypothetical protein
MSVCGDQNHSRQKQTRDRISIAASAYLGTASEQFVTPVDLRRVFDFDPTRTMARLIRSELPLGDDAFKVVLAASAAFAEER